jgi:isopenicillin N synthase-like dioxygenase
VTLTVPVIDIEPFRLGDPLAARRVAEAVDRACRDVGFLAITGHGVDPALVRDTMAVTAAFFDRSLADKLAYVVAERSANRGYAAEGSEALSYSLGAESPPDLFEAFNVGWEYDDTDLARDTDGYIGAERHRFFHPNVWPREPAAFRALWLAYWSAMDDLGRTLMSVFALALGLPLDHFDECLDGNISVMRAINYERRAGAPDPRPDQLRMGAHSDYGSLTILSADDVPGLEISDREGSWSPVRPPAEGFLVNLGDLLAEWTNDRWRSTVHRVVPPPVASSTATATATDAAVRRRSIAWFQQPAYDAVIECLPTCTDADHPPRHAKVTSGDHLIAKLMGPRLLRPSEPTPTVA